MEGGRLGFWEKVGVVVKVVVINTGLGGWGVVSDSGKKWALW